MHILIFKAEFQRSKKYLNILKIGGQDNNKFKQNEF